MRKINKKGSLLDGMYIIIILFAFAIISIVCYYVLHEFHLQSTDKITDTTAVYALTQGEATLLSFDNLFAFILVGLIIATLVGAYFIDTSPIIFWVSLFLLLPFITISALFTNVFQTFVGGDSAFNTTVASYPISATIIDKFPLVALVSFALISLVLYIKWRSF